MKENKGRYKASALNKPSEREQLSYEDVPLRDYRDIEPEPEHSTKQLIHIILILFFSVAVVLAVYNIEYLTPDNISHWFQYDLLGKTEGDGYPANFEGVGVETKNFGLMNGVPVYCSNSNAVVLNPNAGQYQSVQHSFASPVLSINSNYSIIYNLNATGYKVINRNEVVHEGNTKHKIFSADVSSNGVYALLTYGDDYFSTLSVYRSDEKLKFSYSFADYYVNTVSIDRKGEKAVVSGVSAKDGGLISVIYILDFTQESYVHKFEFDNEYIYDLKYLNNDCAVAVGTIGAYYININDKKLNTISYNAKTITAYKLDRNYGMLISLSTNPDGRNCDFLLVKADGSKTNDINIGSEITAFDYRNGTIAILSNAVVTFYTEDGAKLQEFSASTDIRNICFFEEDKLYALGKSSVSVLPQPEESEIQAEESSKESKEE